MIRDGRYVYLGRACLPVLASVSPGRVEILLYDRDDDSDVGLVLVVEAGSMERARTVAAGILGAAGAIDPTRFSVPVPLIDPALTAPVTIEPETSTS